MGFGYRTDAQVPVRALATLIIASQRNSRGPTSSISHFSEELRIGVELGIRSDTLEVQVKRRAAGLEMRVLNDKEAAVGVTAGNFEQERRAETQGCGAGQLGRCQRRRPEVRSRSVVLCERLLCFHDRDQRGCLIPRQRGQKNPSRARAPRRLWPHVSGAPPLYVWMRPPKEKRSDNCRQHATRMKCFGQDQIVIPLTG